MVGGPHDRRRSERDVVLVGGLGGRLDRGEVVGGARLGPVLDRDVVHLEREPLLAGAVGVLARVKAAGEAERLALDEVLGGGFGLAFPDDEVDEEGGRLAVAAVEATEIVATLLPLWVLRSWTARVRRPLPVMVIMRWDLLGSRVVGGCRSPVVPAVRRGGENARASFPSLPGSLPGHW
jgi:hypothetical protein